MFSLGVGIYSAHIYCLKTNSRDATSFICESRSKLSSTIKFLMRLNESILFYISYLHYRFYYFFGIVMLLFCLR
jgi:hypothetical protein